MSCWSKFFTLFALTAATLCADSKVFVLQEATQPAQVSVFSGNPLALQNTLTSVPQASLVLANPQGTRVYILGRSGLVSVLDPKANYQEITSYNVAGGSQIQNAAITPDGQKLIILASDGIRIFDIRQGSPDRPVNTQAFPIAKGSLPHEIAFSFDSRVAYITSQVSRTVTAFDLNSRRVVAQEEFADSPSGVTVSPNGMVYVSTPNTLYEFDGRNGLTMTVMGGFTFVGNAGKPYATHDGRKIIMLSTTAGEIFYFDVAKRAVQKVSSPSVLNDLVIASNTTAYARGRDGVAYQFSIDPIDLPSKANIGFPEDLISLTSSDEQTEARYLYGQTSNRLIRYDRIGAQNQLIEVGTTSPARNVVYIDTPSAAAVARLVSTAASYPVTPSSQSLPLTVRALDSSGRPVPNAEITFSTNTQGLQLLETKVLTNNQGLAITSANVPPLVGRYIVRATGPSGSTEIPVNVEAKIIRQTEFSIIKGNGQISVGGAALNEHLTVRLTDSSGRPVPGVTVNWKLRSGSPHVRLTTSLPSDPTTGTSTTDAEGYSQGGISSNSFQKHIFQYIPYTIDATIRYEDVDRSVQFNGIVYPDNSVNPFLNLRPNITPTNGEYVFQAGAVIPNAFRAEIRTADASPLPVPLPNVGIRAFTPGTNDSQIRCQGAPVSAPTGIVNCTLIVGTTLGTSTMQVVVGELPAPAYNFTYPIRIAAGAPSQISIVRGDGQSGLPGERAPLALVAVVADSGGNILTGIPVSWTISSGDGTLVNARNVTDHTGHTSTEYRFGQRPGPVSITLTAGAATRVFSLTNNAPTGTVSLVSGDKQRARLGLDFATPLTVKVTRNGNLPLVGTKVDFAVKSGAVTLSAESAITDDEGIASVLATAGETEGAAVVTATLVDSSVDFNLTVVDINPQIESILNGASFQEGHLAACSVAVIRGSGFTADLDGVISGTPDENGGQPYALEGVSVKVNDVDAPIFYVSNIEGVEQIGIQVPCELISGENTFVVTAQEVTVSKAVHIADQAPGIFETEFVAGQKQGVVIKADGSYVSPENPAIHGEILTGFFTGLMPTTDVRETNKPGIGQKGDASKIVIGLNHRGMPVISAEYAPGMIGVYTVEFQVNPDSESGDAQPYSIGVRDAEGNMTYSNSSYLPIRAN